MLCFLTRCKNDAPLEHLSPGFLNVPRSPATDDTIRSEEDAESGVYRGSAVASPPSRRVLAQSHGSVPVEADSSAAPKPLAILARQRGIAIISLGVASHRHTPLR